MDIQLWKKRKKEKHLSYDELSEISKIPRRTIISIFMGETTTPRIDTVQAIEKALGIENDGVTVIKNDLTESEERLLSAFRGLLPPMQDYVIEMVEKLVETPQSLEQTGKKRA